MYFGMTHEVDSDSEAAKCRSKTRRSYGLGYPADEPRGKVVDRKYDDLIFNEPFSSTAIDRLSERLFGEEERNKKLVYLCRVPDNIGWLVVNGICGYKKAVTVSIDPMVNLESSFQPKLRDLTCYGCAVWDSSKIIIAGGKKGDAVPSDEVFIYDTVSKTWKSHWPMEVTRGEKPTVVVADSKVFVFGGVQESYPPYDPVPVVGQLWAEFYDFSDLRSWSWAFLPHCPLSIASSSGSLVPNIISYAVHRNGNQILLWLSLGAVLSFNYRDSSWKRYDNPMLIAAGPPCSSTVVVFEDFLFWHKHKTLYAHDLLSDVNIPMHTLPRNGFSSGNFSGGDVPPKFLVHIGRGKLCLFYLVDKRIRYITFWVQISQVGGPPAPHIVVGHSGFLETPSVTGINHALEISS